MSSTVRCRRPNHRPARRALGPPEQVYFGAQAATPPLADRLRFRPSIDIGVGNDVTTAALNVEFAYHFRSAQPWNVFAGGGPALDIIKTSGVTNAEPGFNNPRLKARDSGSTKVD